MNEVLKLSLVLVQLTIIIASCLFSVPPCTDKQSMARRVIHAVKLGAHCEVMFKIKVAFFPGHVVYCHGMHLFHKVLRRHVLGGQGKGPSTYAVHPGRAPG